MKKNMGIIDRILRILAAVAIAVLYYQGIISGVTAAVLIILAIIFVLTSMVSFCPIYLPFNFSTRKETEK